MSVRLIAIAYKNLDSCDKIYVENLVKSIKIRYKEHVLEIKRKKYFF